MISSTRRRRSDAASGVWISRTSAIWSPTVMTGLSEVMGSWKIMAMRVPRRARSLAGVAFRTSSPCSSTWPALASSSRGSSPMTDWAVTDLPEPNSPTTHTISPGPTERETSSTALMRSEPAGSPTVRPSMARTGAAVVSAILAALPQIRLAKRGSSVSRRPSPSMLMASTASARHTPG